MLFIFVVKKNRERNIVVKKKKCDNIYIWVSWISKDFWANSMIIFVWSATWTVLTVWSEFFFS